MIKQETCQNEAEHAHRCTWYVITTMNMQENVRVCHIESESLKLPAGSTGLSIDKPERLGNHLDTSLPSNFWSALERLLGPSEMYVYIHSVEKI